MYSSIFLDLTQGLCNRLRSITSVQVVSKYLNIPLYVNWPVTPECPDKYENLFEININLAPHNQENALILDGYFGYATVWEYQTLIPHIHPNEVNRQAIENMRKIEPLKHIKDIINRVSSKFTSETLGIHVRRTDHQQRLGGKILYTASLNNDQILLNYLDDQPKWMQFFIASDNQESEEVLKSRYDSRVIVHNKKWVEGLRKTSMVDAVIDLYCLARTNRVVGTYWSSFSGYAAELGKTYKTDLKPTIRL